MRNIKIGKIVLDDDGGFIRFNKEAVEDMQVGILYEYHFENIKIKFIPTAIEEGIGDIRYVNFKVFQFAWFGKEE